MSRRVKSFRLSDLAIAKIGALAKQRGVPESAVIERLVLGPEAPEIMADNDRGSAAVARARLHAGVVDPKKMAAFQRLTGMDTWSKKRNG